MNSNYSAVASKDGFVDLKLKDGDFESDVPPRKLVASDQENRYVKPVNADELELDDIDFDNLPLIFGENRSGSGIYGAVFNLTTTIVGAGIMALPATMKVLGLVLGFILIILMGILSEMSVELLIRFSVQCNASSYGEVVQTALGKTARILSEICIIVNNAGVLIVYLIIIGDVMSGSLHHIGVFDQWLGQGVWDHRKLVVLIFLVIFLAPLCALDKIESLSLTSAASVALAVIFVFVAFVVAFIKLVEGKIEAPRMTPDFGSTRAILDLLVVIPIMSNAYVCHFNVQPIYNELEGRSPQKMCRVGRITTVICVLVYASTAVAGYLLFGKETESDVLTNFDKDLGIRFSTALTYIVRIGYVFHLILVFPVIHFSLRQAVDALFFKDSAPLHESRKRCLALTAVLLGLIYFGSTMIPNIWAAFKFTGATTAVSLGFTFPALIALRLSKEGNGLSSGEKALCWLMLVMAVIVSIMGVVGNIYTITN
ncbi:PREDICTED: probable sodium-coupled neutral amino acid transporter 6 isoform X1 [Ipomoea nil]|uniref:probable sodium-coupled neutral amino acid transporter 6 isoform X1 n=1 Tax=Ipomoea nil TaxID=35883 RepID=UPI0009015C6A|nr:PREDICTED: probable sodium-coupled neutral amino acid transporter 6 isoform X1 [Ipomoea nil]XP_019159964.1 PREDICTED: probable sodium-coupled neutral amino acid transporter 6 isoform X1 [Ipomoea nil]XP_019159965.1 PREDICTED: probable sodium-coupled neutral amino acid transporter 6 isoform X1 [Ipomoea nil]